MFNNLSVEKGEDIWAKTKLKISKLQIYLANLEQHKLGKATKLIDLQENHNDDNEIRSHPNTHKPRNRRFNKSIRKRRRKFRTPVELNTYVDNNSNLNDNALKHDPINLSNSVFTEEQKQVLRRGPSFCPAPKDINWMKLHDDWEKFQRNVRLTAYFHKRNTRTTEDQAQDQASSQGSSQEDEEQETLPKVPKTKHWNPPRSSIPELEMFLAEVKKGVPRFTREPPSVLYASSGSTARLVWDYNVKNRTEVFDPLSPEWNFYNKTGSRLRIGVDNGYSKWKFVINEECPTRLRGRVSRKSTATLVISNVTTADSGIYGCNLVLLSGSPIKSRVQLIVTDRPRFNNTFNLTTSAIEGSSLHVHCSASANPVPNVTWVRIMEIPIFINTGVGRVFLRFSNITRHQSGSYECQATNNPNEDPVKTRTKISVKFPVQPANVSVSDIKTVSAVIKWLRPTDDTGCPVIEYKIQLEEISLTKKIMLTNTTVRQLYAVQDLTENTTYGVKVFARNAVGYGKAVCVEFTTEAAKASSLNERLGAIDRATRQKFAGIIGVVIWVGLLGTVVVLVWIKKRCSRRGKDQTNARSKSNKTFSDNINNMTHPAALSKQGTPSQDVSEEKENVIELQTFPFYAKIDKKKKRLPGEIVYAELEQMRTKEDAPVVAPNYFPQGFHETQYADIEH